MTSPHDVPAGGLTTAEARKRLAIHGPNRLAESEPISRLAIFLRQFTNLLIVILVVAAVIALALGAAIDALAILLVVILNGLLGFVQEWRTETALAALKSMLTNEAKVVRDGRPVTLDTRAIVPGDLVILDSGDKVPADIRLGVSTALKVDESVLTGESVPVEKSVGGASNEATVFMGSSVVFGRGEGTVIATGADTAFGQIAELTTDVGEAPTHLQRKLSGLARLLGGIALGLSSVVLLAGLMVGRPLEEMFVTAIALAVAMVPEGLPAVVTITLALGASAMMRRNALVRRLQAVETLGSASVICTDKTGTLTENQMTVTEVWTPASTYQVTGTGYDPTGHVQVEHQRIRYADRADLAAIVDVAMICNHASLNNDDTGWRLVGDPTEGALLTFGLKAGAQSDIRAPVVSEIPFDSDRKRMSVVTPSDTGYLQLVKGAPEAILEVSEWQADQTGSRVRMSETERARAIRQVETMAASGKRVLAFARRESSALPTDEAALVFLGLVGMIDPPRAEVADAISLCRRAGIRIIMITGDAPQTAHAVASSIGLAPERFLSGTDLNSASDAELDTLLTGSVHFARTAPVHKMRLVERLQARGDLVAMTGDGVNDAPALRQADIGIAMGQRGTDAAKEASDLVLIDDNFATIVGAIEEGRRQFANIQRFVRYLLASNAGELVAILINLFLGGPLIFLATQILWMNLITDGVTAVALGMEEAAPDQMDQPPVRKDLPILDIKGVLLICGFGLYTGLVSLWIFYTHLPEGTDFARTLAFTAMVVFEKVSVFAFRSFRLPFARIGWFSNPALLLAFVGMMGLQFAAIYWPPLQKLLHTVALPVESLGLVAVCALPLLIVPEAFKLVRSRSRERSLIW